MRARSAAILVLAAMIIASGCGGSDGATSADAGTPATIGPGGYEPEFVEGACPVQPPADMRVTCGVLRVPENRADPHGTQVELAVVRLHYEGDDRRPDPVVYLHGGPGSATLPDGVTGRADFARQARRDLIVFDQRGAGFSTPNLECPEREAAIVEVLAAARPFEEELETVRTALAACHARLRSEGWDLGQYNTWNVAVDVEDLRRALGIDEWNLWAISYGTRVALAVMRSFPDGVRSAVLDSVYPPSRSSIEEMVDDGFGAFDRLANGCGTDPACESAHGDLRDELDAALASLDDDPFTFTWTAPDGSTRRLTITGADAAAGLFNALYDTSLIPVLPSIIADVASGGRTMVETIASVGIPFINDISEGAYLSFECTDNGGRLDPDDVAEALADPGNAATILLAAWQPFCDVWPTGHLPDDFAHDVTSDIPTLVYAGEYDPVTPATGSRRAAEALGNATFVQVPRGGHGVARVTGCTTGIMLTFIEDPGEVDTSCVPHMPLVPFR